MRAYRMWDKDLKKMHKVTLIDFKNDEVIDENGDIHKFSDIELMQFTGLYDKNGKEIYEGDIVKIKGEDCKYIVDFYNGCFVCVDKFDEHYEHGKLLGDVSTFFMEVIGNVWENEGLLNDSK